ncbi:MAG TPA: radical SAM protein [Opitutaceae bacterium]|nr:radical SAM protein [Opitutaceae bacterium]
MPESSGKPASRPAPVTVRSGAKNGDAAHAFSVNDTAFGRPRDFLGNRFVYAVISPRARGLSLGVNMTPDRLCNFNCLYCEVDRRTPSPYTKLEAEAMGVELRRTLTLLQQGGLRERPWYHALPDELLQLHHVALSGDGEPTLAPNFAEAVQTVIRTRALGGFPFFKIVLITNATGLDRSEVQGALQQFAKSDEIWAKLDGGTQAFINRINRPNVPLEKVLWNILTLARRRPVTIQSLFPAINGEEPPREEIEQYAQRLWELKNEGAQISLVQIYSAARPMAHAECSHLPLKTLSRIAQTVRHVTGLKAEVF